MSKIHAILEGIPSVQAVLESNSREILRIFILNKKQYDRELAQLRRRAQAQQVAVEVVPEERIREFSKGQRHGGIIALVGERRFCRLDALLPEHQLPFIVMLDGIEDPYNLGYAIRSLYAAGVDSLVLRPRNWRTATTTIVRASAGSSERLPIAIAQSPVEAARFFRSEGVRIMTTAKDKDAESLYEVDLTVPILLIIGGERRGITRSLREQTDVMVQIPYGREFARSMGTVAATSVIAFEVMRQRHAWSTRASDVR